MTVLSAGMSSTGFFNDEILRRIKQRADLMRVFATTLQSDRPTAHAAHTEPTTTTEQTATAVPAPDQHPARRHGVASSDATPTTTEAAAVRPTYQFGDDLHPTTAYRFAWHALELIGVTTLVHLFVWFLVMWPASLMANFDTRGCGNRQTVYEVGACNFRREYTTGLMYILLEILTISFVLWKLHHEWREYVSPELPKRLRWLDTTRRGRFILGLPQAGVVGSVECLGLLMVWPEFSDFMRDAASFVASIVHLAQSLVDHLM